MDNEKTLKRKSISLIAKNLILLLSVAFTGVIGAWSWFVNNTTATAKGISVSCEIPDGIEIAVVEHGAPEPTAYKTGAIELTEDSPIIKNLIATDEQTGLTEVTSDGKLFQKPLLQQNDGEATPIKDVVWDLAYEGRDYMCFDLYIRSEGELDIYLDAGSSVESVAEKLVGSNADNRSNMGDFSKDCIVGATRVSVIDSDKDATRRLLWIPRPDIYLYKKIEEDNDNTFFVTTGEVSEVTTTHKTWSGNDDLSDNSVLHNELTIDAKVSEEYPENSGKYALKDKMFITTLNTKKDDGYYYSHVTCNLWIEGEDSEARLALAGGKFSFNIKLKGE